MSKCRYWGLFLLACIALPLRADQHSPELYMSAFEGAIGCSALAHIESNTQVLRSAKIWSNRSFMFGRQAAHFYTKATGQSIAPEKVFELRKEAVLTLQSMSNSELRVFQSFCSDSYEEFDNFCKANKCLHELE